MSECPHIPPGITPCPWCEIERLRADNARLNAQALSLACEISKARRERDEARADCERLDWIERNLIEGKWDGTIGRPKSWHMAGPYRHTLQTLRGNTLREAIDAALAADQPSEIAK